MAKKQQQNVQTDEEFRLSTQADVARAFEVERSTVHGWIQKGMPGKDGAYFYHHITRWLLSVGPWKSERYREALIEKSITRSLESQ